MRKLPFERRRGAGTMSVASGEGGVVENIGVKSHGPAKTYDYDWVLQVLPMRSREIGIVKFCVADAAINYPVSHSRGFPARAATPSFSKGSLFLGHARKAAVDTLYHKVI